MIGDLKPTPTTYKDVEFRSRLEARYAVLFDELGIEWHYEPEGVQLPPLNVFGKDWPSVWYLPDFWLPKVPQSSRDLEPESTGPRWKSAGGQVGVWLEIKPNTPIEPEERLALGLQAETGQRVILAHGIPGWGPHGCTVTAFDYSCGDSRWFQQCNNCQTLLLEFNCEYLCDCGTGGSPGPTDSEFLIRAHRRAGGYRFA